MSDDAFERARALVAAGREDLAEPYLREYCAGNPDDGLACALLAWSLCRRGEAAEAKPLAMHAVAREPESAYIHYVAAACVGASDRESALRHAETAVALDPANADYLHGLSLAYLRQNKVADALRAAEAGLAINPEHADCQAIRARALSRLGRHADARASAAVALAREADDPVVLSHAGWVELRAGSYRAAEERFAASLRTDPHGRAALKGMALARFARRPVVGVTVRPFLCFARMPRGLRVGWILGVYLTLWMSLEWRPDAVHPIAWRLLQMALLFGAAGPVLFGIGMRLYLRPRGQRR